MTEQFLTTRGRKQWVNRGVEPLFLQRTVEMQLHVSGAFELLENQLIHAAAGLGKRGGENRKAAAFFDVARAPEKFLRLDQCLCLDTAGHDPPFARLQIIISAR